jgi:hypothetical protein
MRSFLLVVSLSAVASCTGAPFESGLADGRGDAGADAQASAAQPGGDAAPPSFAGAASATASPNAITLAWTAARDDVSKPEEIVYLVYQATSSGQQSFAAPVATTSPGATSFSVGGLPKSTRFHFVVRARDAAGNVDANTTEVSATTPDVDDNLPPTFGGATNAAATSPASVTVSWSAAADDVTPPGQIVYLVYAAAASGSQSFGTPTFTLGTACDAAGKEVGVTFNTQLNRISIQRCSY